MTRSRDNSSPPALRGEVLPPSRQSSSSSAMDTVSPGPPALTAMRGFAALFQKYGMKRIADAYDEQLRAGRTLVQLYTVREEVVALSGRARKLGDIANDAAAELQATLTAKAHARDHAEFNREMDKLKWAAELDALKRKLRTDAEVGKQQSVGRVAAAKQDATIARRGLSATQRITKAEIDKVVLASLQQRHNALASEANAEYKALQADAVRKGLDLNGGDPSEGIPLNELVAELESIVQTYRERGYSDEQLAIVLDMLMKFRGRGE